MLCIFCDTFFIIVVYAELCVSPPTPAVLSRAELVQQLRSVHNGLTDDTAMLVVETSSDTLGGSLGGVQRLTTDGGVLEGRVARSLLMKGGANTEAVALVTPSPASSVAGEDFTEDSDGELS